MTESRRTDPIAVKAIRHAMAEMHQRDGTCFDVLRVEHREIAAILLRAPDRREQPAIALGGVSPAFDEHRFGNRVAGGQQIMPEPLALAVYMHESGQRSEPRQLGIGAGVQAMAVSLSGAAVINAREFAGEIVEIGLREAVGIACEVESPAAVPRARL